MTAHAAATAVHPTTQRQLDEAVARLREAAPAFARLPIPDRIVVARSMQSGFARVADQVVRAACAAKGIPAGTPVEAQERSTGPWPVIRQLRLTVEALAALERTGNTPVGPVSRAADGRLTVRVFPASAIDGVLFAGVTVDVRMQAGITEAEMHDSRAAFYRGRRHAGRTVLILGAGNLTGIPAMDVVTKLFNEGKVCLLKMNPINAYAGPLIEAAFAEAIRQGFLAVVYGGADEGGYLAHHPGVDEIHLTGSSATYDTLVWGPPGPERESRKAHDTPLLTKPLTAELGNVSPVLVVPGPYKDRELSFQAESIAGALVHNAGFNCNTPRVLITPRGWAARASMLEAVERALTVAPTRPAYYPGAEERWSRISGGRAEIRTVGQTGSDRLPWTLLPALDATDPRERAFTEEPFCPALAETEVGSDDPLEFLERAVEFANNRLWGTLSADLVVHPASLKDPRIAEAVERAIARLRYGVVSVNSWNGYAFVFCTPPWGAFPGSTPADIQSGTGWVHNTAMLEGIEKAVLRHPITAVPKPTTFPSHRTAHVVLRRLTRLEERASWTRVPGVVAAAMRG
ncbi:MAG TPA: aldehyde dehydrogenase family protein [Gemmatimonadales bacterium]|nr:aldehyde dehydrogenase family protein [Gemmatimonadales bacterium]